ncbi:MAG: tripartite tricarboxylate transporter TctB family protein [Proteobacteria bacterium]|nr:tripartite tricarboxylate transporter TctB family protein [Pseudomonadota bacterium]
MEQTKHSQARGGITHSLVDAISAFIVFAVGVVMMIDNYRIGAGWADEGPESGYFPFRIGVILCIASIVVMLRSLFGKKRNLEVFVSWERFKPVLLVLIPTTLYVLAIQFLGIYVASALFVGAFMRVMDRSSWLKTLLVSVGVNALLFWMFEMQFMVPLPKGPLEALFGY